MSCSVFSIQDKAPEVPEGPRPIEISEAMLELSALIFSKYHKIFDWCDKNEDKGFITLRTKNSELAVDNRLKVLRNGSFAKPRTICVKEEFPLGDEPYRHVVSLMDSSGARVTMYYNLSENFLGEENGEDYNILGPKDGRREIVFKDGKGREVEVNSDGTFSITEIDPDEVTNAIDACKHIESRLRREVFKPIEDISDIKTQLEALSPEARKQVVDNVKNEFVKD